MTPPETDPDIQFTHALALGLERNCRQCLHAQVQLRELADIPHAAIEDHAFPTVAFRTGGDQVAEQCTAQRAPAIHDQHLAVAWLTELLLDQ